MVMVLRLHHHTGQGDRSVDIKACGGWFSEEMEEEVSKQLSMSPVRCLRYL